MIQEILTYLIIAVAVFWAALKIYHRFFKKAKQSQKVNFKKDSVTIVHNCSDCSAAGCELRDLPKKILEKNINQCNENSGRSQ